jgi:hypothetical protein
VEDEDSNAAWWNNLYKFEKLLCLKTDTVARFFKVITAFPFVIVVSSMNLTSRDSWVRSVVGIRLMNFLIYIAPIFYVKYVLEAFTNTFAQRVAIFFYTFLYLFPVAYVVVTKVKVSTSTHRIEEVNT